MLIIFWVHNLGLPRSYLRGPAGVGEAVTHAVQVRVVAPGRLASEGAPLVPQRHWPYSQRVFGGARRLWRRGSGLAEWHWRVVKLRKDALLYLAAHSPDHY